VANPPPPEQLRGIYREEYFTERLAQHGRSGIEAAAWRSAVGNARRRMTLLRRFAPRGGRLLDVGCGTGAFLSVANSEYACSGVDVSAEAVAVVRHDLGIEAQSGDLRSLQMPRNHFDVITLFDVIEHVPEPDQLLVEVQHLLTPDGVCVMTTGDTDSLICRLTGRWWHLMTPPEHLTYFSRQGLLRMALRTGWTPLFAAHLPVMANVGYMATKLASVCGRPLSWLPWLVRACRLDDLDLGVNLLDVWTLVVKKGPRHRAQTPAIGIDGGPS